MKFKEHLINEAKGFKAIDASGDHPPQGYPEIDIPPKLLNNIGQALWGGNKDIMKVWKHPDYWTFQVSARNFQIRHDDFKKLVRIGWIGVSYEPPKSMLLYFKH